MVKVIANTDPVEVEELLWLGYRQCKLGFDVGANCGQSIPSMLRFCDRVRAFEPNREAFKEMRQRAGGQDVQNIAVSDHDGFVQLAQLGGKQLETGQLVTPGTKGMEWDPGDWSAIATEPFPCGTVDTLSKNDPPGFLKVDTEGHEVQVLRGAAQTIASNRPEWLIEFHSPGGYAECVDILKAARYKVETVRHPHYQRDSALWRGHGWIRAFPR